MRYKVSIIRNDNSIEDLSNKAGSTIMTRKEAEDLFKDTAYNLTSNKQDISILRLQKLYDNGKVSKETIKYYYNEK